MKNVLKNSTLVFVLSFLFVLPFFGFGFIEYEPENEVLGLQTQVENLPMKEVDDSNRVVVSDQIELTLSLSSDEFQKFYDVIPEEKLSEGDDYLVIIPSEYKEQGLSAELEMNEVKADLVIKKPAEVSPTKISLVIVILR